MENNYSTSVIFEHWEVLDWQDCEWQVNKKFAKQPTKEKLTKINKASDLFVFEMCYSQFPDETKLASWNNLSVLKLFGFWNSAGTE